jgi:hypothetical protein
MFVCWPERRVEPYARQGQTWVLTEAREGEVLPVAALGVELPT